MDNLLTIIEQNNKLDQVTSNFDALREEGTAYIAQLGHQLWTDFNVHDPGITILEVLCFAINDLAFRTDFPIEDLLAERIPYEAKKHFFSAAEILTCNPVTPMDFQKLIIDEEGVKNAWVLKDNTTSYNGLYKILLDVEMPKVLENESAKKKIKEQVLKKLCAYRNLCEDFQIIDFIDTKEIGINAKIVIDKKADANEVYAQVIHDIQEFLSFSPRFYSLKEMLDKGKTCDEIFQSAILENGFLDDDELERAKLRRVIYKSDLYRVIMDVEDVEAVKELKFYLNNEEVDTWCLDICKDEGQTTICQFKPILDIDTENTTLDIYKEEISITPNQREVDEKLALIKQINRRPSVNTIRDRAIPKGVYRDLDQHFTIQEDFPLAYRVGKNQVPPSFSAKEKALVKQLKAYLTFFDQILANYLAQLGNLKNSLSVCPAPEDRALFHKSLKGLDPAIDALFFEAYQINDSVLEKLDGKIDQEQIEQLIPLKQHPPLLKKQFLKNVALLLELSVKDEKVIPIILSESLVEQYYVNQLAEIIENDREKYTRRNQILDHLIARFGEEFSDYALSLFQACQDEACKANQIKVKDTLLECKTDFLKNIPVIGRDRGKGMNYKSEDCIKKELFWNAENVSGLKKRVSKLLCLKNSNRVQLSCPPKVEVVKKIDEAQKTFSYVVVEKGKTPNNPDTVIYLKGKKDYTLRSKSKRELEKIRLALFESKQIVNPEFTLSAEPVTDDTSQLRLKKNEGDTIAQSDLLPTDDAAALLADLEALLFPDDCETEGFHVLEHILLRPFGNIDTKLDDLDTGNGCTNTDPYSFWISVIALDSWKRCAEENGGRKFFEQLVRRETPAHVGINFLWLSGIQMYHFEYAYKNWLYDKAREGADDCQIEESQTHLIEIMKELTDKQEQ